MPVSPGGLHPLVLLFWTPSIHKQLHWPEDFLVRPHPSSFYISLFTPQKNPVIPMCRWENWDTEHCGNLFKVTGSIRGRVGMETQVCGSSPCSWPLHSAFFKRTQLRVPQPSWTLFGMLQMAVSSVLQTSACTHVHAISHCFSYPRSLFMAPLYFHHS